MNECEKSFILCTCRPIHANFRLNFFSPLHINPKIATSQSKFVYIMHKLYFWGKIATLERVFIKNISRPLWHCQDEQPKPMSPLSPHLKVECR